VTILILLAGFTVAFPVIATRMRRSQLR
jgi:hypothetical protein